MCELLEEYATKKAEKAVEDSAKKLLDNQKLTYEEIAECTGLSLERIKELGTLRHI